MHNLGRGARLSESALGLEDLEHRVNVWFFIQDLRFRVYIAPQDLELKCHRLTMTAIPPLCVSIALVEAS